ncbi:probable disease resistance protein At1g15890 [Manihot esculenta]|uniref:probable disease resistance protein At1g15890 n=1 Tax=Manihot esculenta TaxID=3983 RepID=UPI000B5D4DF6|nr:probable disease resistance protein At1g15890 [Manihot esculenta]
MEEEKNHQNPLTVGMQLGDCKLVETEHFNLEWIHQKSKICLQLLFIDDDCVFHRNSVIHLSTRDGSVNLKGKASASSSSIATDLPEAISSRFQELEKTTEAGCSKATSSAEPKILQIQEMHAESHHSALEPAAMLSDTSLEATAPLSRLIKNDRILNEILSRIGYSKTRIGVYGGAVGKTTLLKSLKVHPDIREMFQFVIWVTVPKVWKLEAVQLEIAKQLPLDDKKSISSWKLMSFLNKVKFLLILAGIHQVISLDFIGIPDPTPENGCNIVLTAVSEEICDRMEVDWKINLEGLLKEFCENAGKIDYSSDLQPLALEVVDLCGYHWHAIFLMSKALKDEYDVCVWNNAIEILRTQPAFPGRDLENIMADVLKFSYSRLPDDTTRRCLKNCALFFENQEIARDSLIDNWMSDDLTDMYSKGQKVLETLVAW